MQPQPFQVFMSYSHEDEEFALWLMQEIERYGVPVWRDREGIRVGDNWTERIERAINACSHLLIILSPSSVQRPEVLNELNYAFESNKQILPVLYYSCPIPAPIQPIQYVDFRDLDNYTLALNKLTQRFRETQHLAPSRQAVRPASAPQYSYTPALTSTRTGEKKFALSNDRWIAGVCGGLAEYWGMSPLFVRIVFAVIGLLTSGASLLIYPVLWLIMRQNTN